MWVPLNVKNYQLKHRPESNSEIFFVTDAVLIWQYSVKQDTLIGDFKELNKSLQWPDKSKAISCIIDLFCKEGPSVKKEVAVAEERLTVSSSSAISGYPYRMVLNLQLMPPNVFYDEFTYYLLSLSNAFYKREKRLLEIIRSKDVELEEYRQEGYEIKRRGVITAPFNFEGFDNDAIKISSQDVLPNPASILCYGQVQHMMSKFQTPHVKVEITNGNDTATEVISSEGQKEKPVNIAKSKPSLGVGMSSEETQSVEEKIEPIAPRKKKKTFATLSL